VHYLKRYLGGEAKEAVEGYFFLTSTEAYNTAKELLKRPSEQGPVLLTIVRLTIIVYTYDHPTSGRASVLST
jgi:hypothetical protein